MSKKPDSFFGRLLRVVGSLALLLGIGIAVVVGLLVVLALSDPQAEPARWKRKIEEAATIESIHKAWEEVSSGLNIRSGVVSLGKVCLVVGGPIGIIALLWVRWRRRLKKVDALVARWADARAQQSTAESADKRTLADKERELLEKKLARGKRVVPDLFDLREDSESQVHKLPRSQFLDLAAAVCNALGREGVSWLYMLLVSYHTDKQTAALLIAPRLGNLAASLIPDIMKFQKSSCDKGFQAQCRNALEQLAKTADPKNAELVAAAIREEEAQKTAHRQLAYEVTRLRQATCQHRWKISTNYEGSFTSRVCAVCGLDRSSDN